MKKIFLLLAVFCLALIVLPASADNSVVGPKGKVVVANRASGTISVIDARSDTLIGTYSLPTGESSPEPMYVTYSKGSGLVFVGDRANNRVVVFDKDDFSVVWPQSQRAVVFSICGLIRTIGNCGLIMISIIPQL